MPEKVALIESLYEAIVNYDPEESAKAAHEIVEAGVDPMSAVEKGLSRGLKEVGDRYEKGEYFLPELVRAGEAGKSALAILDQKIKGERKVLKRLGKVLIGTVEGDIHDVGKNIVVAMLYANDFEVIDLGVDVPTEKFIQKVRELKPDVLGLSALLTTSRLVQRIVIQKLKEANLRDKVKVIVGGAPVTKRWAEEIGADAYGADAIDGVKKIKRLL